MSSDIEPFLCHLILSHFCDTSGIYIVLQIHVLWIDFIVFESNSMIIARPMHPICIALQNECHVLEWMKPQIPSD